MMLARKRFCRWKKIVACILMIGVGVWLGCLGTASPTWAMEVTFPEGLEDVSDKEFEEMMDLYEAQMEYGKKTQELSSEIIKDPPLLMEDAGNGKIRYILPDQNFFTVTAPKDMITAQSVTIDLPDGAMGLVKKDDDTAFVMTDNVFSEPGVYQIRLLFYQPPSEQFQDYGIYEVNYRFTIIEKQNGVLGVMTAPDGFEIFEVLKNGVRQDAADPQYYFLQEDGNYEFWYRDLNTSQLCLKTSFVKDTTAPFLMFSKDITEKDVTGPVEFTPSESKCTIAASYNGNYGTIETTTLTAGGFYRLEVFDAAGNRRAYYLKLRQTYQLFDTKVIILIVMFLLGMGGRLFFLRRNMRVI